MTISRLELTNFTVFEKASFEFCPGINVLIGENGTGKSHVLKAMYAAQKTAGPNDEESPLDRPTSCSASSSTCFVRRAGSCLGSFAAATTSAAPFKSLMMLTAERR
jgi:recombinational DNA repair ATPase RecF